MRPGAYASHSVQDFSSGGGGGPESSSRNLIDPNTGLPRKSRHFVDYTDDELDSQTSGAQGLANAHIEKSSGGVFGRARAAYANAVGRCGRVAATGADRVREVCEDERVKKVCNLKCLVVVGVLLLAAGLIGAFVPKSTASGGGGTVSGAGGQGDLSAQGGGADATGDGGGGPPYQETERFSRLKSRVLDAGITSPTALSDPTTPQYQALRWISDYDESQPDPTGLYVLQRYALAVFWYSTYELASTYDELVPLDDPTLEYVNWINSSGWMTDAGICSWYGVSCHHRPGTDPEDTVYDDDGGVTHLNLTDNAVRGRLPREVFTSLADLRVLYLDRNELTGTIPSELGHLKRLRQFHVGTNLLTGKLPLGMGGLTECTHFYTSENDMNGTVPTEIGNMVSLREVGLFDNEFSGGVPTEMGELVHLDSMYLDDNFLSGTIPTQFGRLYLITDVRLRRNFLTGTVPSALGSMELLEVLYLDSNDLEGTIPGSDLAKLSHLDQLFLYKNSITGTLPTELGLLNDLDHLYLDHNLLSGSLPSEWGVLSDLRDLFLYENELTGTIPATYGGMEDLRRLRLYNNSLSGTLPGAALGGLFNLVEVEVQGNELSGGVPSELAGLVNLLTLRVHDNELTGVVPEEVCLLTERYVLTEFTSDCNRDELECRCCTDCM